MLQSEGTPRPGGICTLPAPKQESNEILISMNKGRQQRQLEAEFVSSNQSKHFERVKCALAISLETDISNDAVAIESFGGCKNVCHILKTSIQDY